jgi:hypothetical protein
VLQQRRLLTAADSDAELRLAAHLGPPAPAHAAGPAEPIGTRMTTALVLGLLAVRAIRDVFSHRA